MGKGHAGGPADCSTENVTELLSLCVCVCVCVSVLLPFLFFASSPSSSPGPCLPAPSRPPTLPRTHADCPQLLDTEDMVRLREPDWKCVYTYIQEFYRCLVQKGLVKTKKS